MKKASLFILIAIALSFVVAAYPLWRTNILFQRVGPKHVFVNKVESGNTRVYKSIGGDYIVFVDGDGVGTRTFVVYNSTKMVSMASRLNWSIELPWVVFAPDTLTGSIIAGQFQDKLSGGLDHLTSEGIAFRAGETTIDISL